MADIEKIELKKHAAPLTDEQKALLQQHLDALAETVTHLNVTRVEFGGELGGKGSVALNREGDDS